MSQTMQSVVLNASKAALKVDFIHTKKAALILRSINHKLRQQIIKLLDEQQKMTVTAINIIFALIYKLITVSLSLSLLTQIFTSNY